MRRGVPVMLWAVVWGIVVAVSAAIVWSAITRAGAHVANPAAPRLPSSNTVTLAPGTPSGSTSTPTSKPTHKPTSRPTPRPTPSDTRTDSPGPVGVQGSWSGQPGRVTATCRARQIRLDAAVPADGFTVEIGSRGPETLEIEFHQAQGETEFKVRGVCRSDGPRFAVEQE